MGSRTIIFCDWCGLETPDDDRTDLRDWKECDGDTLCGACVNARNAAILSAREAARATQRHGEDK